MSHGERHSFHDGGQAAHAAPGHPADTPVYPHRYWTLAVLSLALMVAQIDHAVVNVALPNIVHDLGATTTQLQWIVDSYVLVFAGLLLTGGSLSDRYGRK